MSAHRTVFPFASVYFKSALVQRRQLCIYASHSHMASVHEWALTCSSERHSESCSYGDFQRFSSVISNITVLSVKSRTVLPEGSKTTNLILYAEMTADCHKPLVPLGTTNDGKVWNIIFEIILCWTFVLMTGHLPILTPETLQDVFYISMTLPNLQSSYLSVRCFFFWLLTFSTLCSSL